MHESLLYCDFQHFFFRLCKLCKTRDYPSETLGKVRGIRLERNITSEKLSGLLSKTEISCKHLVINRVNKTWNWPKFKLKAFLFSLQLLPRSNVFPFKFLWKTNICAKPSWMLNALEMFLLFPSVYFYGFCVWKAWRSSPVVNNKKKTCSIFSTCFVSSSPLIQLDSFQNINGFKLLTLSFSILTNRST